MLTLTDDAKVIVKAIAESLPGIETSGLRLTATDPNSNVFAVAIVPLPLLEDHIIDDKAGARVYLDENASIALADKILDADVDDNGAVSFTFEQVD